MSTTPPQSTNTHIVSDQAVSQVTETVNNVVEQTSSATQNVGSSAFFDKLTEATTIISTKLIEAAPEAADALLSIVQLEGLFVLSSTTFILAVILATGLKVAFSTLAWAKKYSEENRNADGAEFFIPALSFLLTALIAFCFAVPLFVFYNWLSVFYPEGAIALRALEAAGIPI